MKRVLHSVVPERLVPPRLSVKRRALLRAIAQSMTLFGLAFIGLLWLSLAELAGQQEKSMLRQSEQETANLSLVVEKSVQRTADNLDRILKYLRETYKIDHYTTNWARIVHEKFTIDHQAVQVAVNDQNGMLVTSSAMLHPKKPLYLGDRAHFIFQKNSKTDSLFISKPVIGRASGKQSVQFTRRFNHADGSFAGVVVISLDPGRLANSFSKLQLGSGHGFALEGNDGIIRSGSGIYGGLVGKRYVSAHSPVSKDIYGTLISDDQSNGGLRVTAERMVKGYPLKVIVTSDYAAKIAAWQATKRGYTAGAAILSLIVVLAMVASAMSRLRFETKMNYLARHDALTGLSNRFHLGEVLDDACANLDCKGNFALHLVDLDGFKLVNDAYGHPTGDALLLLAAQRLRLVLRSSDVVARLGGDEFAVIQHGIKNEGDTMQVASRICELLAEPFQLGALQIKIGASIGIAVGGVDAFTANDLLRLADMALYGAKGSGRGSYCFFSEELNAKALARGELETGLTNALQNHELVLFYQPIVSTVTGEVTSFEALLRWQHPERGLVSPLDFIPLAEETGLIIPIGEWIFEQACADLARCPEHLSVSVNCSPVQMNSLRLIASVKTALEKSGLRGDRLRIEITESTLMSENSLVVARLEELRGLGVKISIDDFGTGFSCLSYLQRYPIDCIKIDRSFVSKMASEQDSTPIVVAIVGLAKGLKMTTVAEGVETAAQLRELTDMGCTEAQGYLFSPPRPAQEILPRSDKLRDAA